MIKIAICDDETNIRSYLTSLIQAQSCPCEVVEYASAGDCLADRREIDLFLLDIELAPSGLDGMELASQIRERSTMTQPVIIFVTSYERYVFDAFDVGAFQYLLKPVNEEKFAQVFARAVEQITTNRENPQKGPVLTLQSANTSKTILLDSIYYIESCDHKVVLHLRDGQFAYYAKIRDLELELQDQFFRIHKGYLVNLSYVAGYSKRSVVLTNGERLLLSKYKYQDFVKAYLHFLKKGAGL
ncbi:DNA-binding response regulator [Pseudoflavonifractor sp. 524-17]|uniref:LytR/AlgR family response regulator transcription factor n=1 Tax=Pseudoflavonifractor sp. 524-17 TaxID=2304577 RepID=UPI00137AE0E9|nr:LytTR family DNA-binding domain-containing protein [Pseudoflavonifractor sp. 524-17]NCE64190.1 DNA-binding response regulator [Pseudoflavonifractor sp. 524-17]